jgi:hypothetical protein
VEATDQIVPLRARLSHGLRLAAVSIGGGVAVQAIGLLCGVCVVRTLTPEHYAIFGLAAAFASMLTVLADSGVSQAVLSLGGKCELDRVTLGEVVKSCAKVLSINGLIVAIIVPPLWIWLASRHTNVGFQLLATVVALLAGFYATLGADIYRNVLLLHRRVGAVQRTDGGGSLVRLVSLLSLLQVLPLTLIAVICGVFGEIFRYRTYRNAGTKLIETHVAPTAEATREIYRFMRRVLPTSIYFAVSTQILFLLMALVATNVSLAGAGALSRFHQIYQIVPMVCALVLAPRWALRTQPSYGAFAQFALVGIGLAAMVSVPMAVVPQAFLWILGPSYAHLVYETRLLSVSSGLASASGVITALCTARGWLMPPWLFIPLHLAALLASILLFRLDTVAGYMKMHVLVQSVVFALTCTFAAVMLRTRLASPTRPQPMPYPATAE